MMIQEWVSRRRHDISNIRATMVARRNGNRGRFVLFQPGKIFTMYWWLAPLQAKDDQPFLRWR